MFERSKKFLIHHNLLEIYDPKKPIVVASDASPYDIGAILSHIIDGKEKPVLYASSTLWKKIILNYIGKYWQSFLH